MKPTTYARLSRGLIALAAAAALFAAVEATASGGPDLRFEPAPVHRLDDASLQRGARTFVNYCLNCHSAKYMRYNRLQDIGLTEEQIRDNLILGDAKIGDTMSIAMRPVDAKGWFGAPPPDLSVESRVRGKDWLYNYSGSTATRRRRPGWNNLVFPNVGMPHVLWSLSGTSKLASTEYENHEAALAAAIGTKGLALVQATRREVRRPHRGAQTCRDDVAGRVPRDGRGPRQLHGLHGRAGAQQTDHAGDHRADVPRLAVLLRVLAQAGVLEGRALASMGRAPPSRATPSLPT